jgi:hyperosmotically inducible protein
MRAILLLLVVIVVGFFALNYWNGDWRHPSIGRQVGTTGTIDTSKAKQAGAEIGEKAADAANKVGEAVGEAALTTKIKAKMTLDDTVKARDITVTTNGSVVTLTGVVGSKAEHDRAMQLARETSGVTKVVDHITVK